MKKSPKRASKYLTRLFVVLAIAAVAVAVVVIVSNFKVDSNDKTSGNGKAHPAKQKKKKPHRSKAKTYTVKSGDTLIAISHKTGVPVAELQALNPEIDPQILIAGEVLKLR